MTDPGAIEPTDTVELTSTAAHTRHAEPSDPEAGLATAEYAIATIAAVGFAGLLIAVLQSDTVRGLLEGIVSQALSV